jgi:hypothetical protein
MNQNTDTQIRTLYDAGRQDVESLIAPLAELAQHSTTLVMGYGQTQAGLREEMIPYFHVCGSKSNRAPVRVLIVGGWVGTEIVTPLAAARIIAALEANLEQVQGVEITAFPVANLEAHRANVFLAEGHGLQDVRCWDDSPQTHVQVLERELGRYDYDVVILLRQHPRASECDAEAWLDSEAQRIILGDALSRCSTSSAHFRWKQNPINPLYLRTFTRIPNAERQPAEIIIGLPGALSAEEQSAATLAPVLTLIQAMHKGRMEGLI